MRVRAVYGLVVVSGMLAGAALAAFDGADDVGASQGADVIINELMINPQRTYDSRGEWIELYNRGDEAADLEGWTIGDEIYDDIVLPSIVIEPGAFVLLARNGDAYRNGGVAADHVYGNAIILWNSDDLVVLRDTDGMPRDVVDYRNAGFTVPDGRSMALVDPALDNGDGASWCASTTVMARGDLGSPGAANRCTLTVNPLVITEILQNPGATSDYTGEWFEVHNPGTEPVDMTGYTIKDDDHDQFVVDGAVVVPAGGYAVFGASAADNGGVALDFTYGAGCACTTTATSSSSPTATACRSIAFGGTTAGRSPTPTAPRCRSPIPAPTTRSARTGARRRRRGRSATRAPPASPPGAHGPGSSRS